MLLFAKARPSPLKKCHPLSPTQKSVREHEKTYRIIFPWLTDNYMVVKNKTHKPQCPWSNCSQRTHTAISHPWNQRRSPIRLNYASPPRARLIFMGIATRGDPQFTQLFVGSLNWPNACHTATPSEANLRNWGQFFNLESNLLVFGLR